MKYRLIGFVAFITLIVTSFVASFLVSNIHKSQRVHHHLLSKEKYNCISHKKEDFCSHLPIVSVETAGKQIPGDKTDNDDMFNESIYSDTQNGEPMEMVTFKVFDNPDGNNHPTDIPSVSTQTLIRKRGHMSRGFEKAQYALKFIDDSGLDNDISVMGMSAHNEWVLYGPYLDKSLIRNYLLYNISGEIMDYSPNVRYCELFLDGDYRGLYLMCESITSGDGTRLDLTVTEKGNKVTGYLLKFDRASESNLPLTREIYTMSERQGYGYSDITIDYPGKNNLTEEMAKQIELEVSAFDKAIYSYDYDSEKYGYKTYINMDSFVDYFIINEFSKNLDAGAYSTYMYKRPGEKYKMCVWDFNSSCDNYPDNWTGFGGFSLNDKLYFVSLCRDKDFVEAVIRRYYELRKTFLNEKYLLNYIDETVNFLGDAAKRNEDRWQAYIKSDTLAPNTRNAYTYGQAVKQLKSWIVNRGIWLDKNIHTLRQYSAESKVKKYNEVTE